jgi:DNA invertase Pin-like site-specific DNA recombinase
MELVGIIEDAGKSAKDLRRPGVQKILKMAKAREIDAVIIIKLDRMFRNTENALTTARDFEKRGVALHSIGESLDTNSAMGKFFFTLTAALAEMERGLIGERTRAALARKREKGEFVGGKTPFGFDLQEGGKLVRNSEEQTALGRMKKWRSSGVTFQGIADKLNRAGIGPKYGGAWDRAKVFHVLDHAAR